MTFWTTEIVRDKITLKKRCIHRQCDLWPEHEILVDLQTKLRTNENNSVNSTGLQSLIEQLQLQHAKITAISFLDLKILQ